VINSGRELADQASPEIAVREDEIPEILWPVQVVVVHLDEQGAAGGGGSAFEHGAESETAVEPQHRRRM